MFKFFKKQRQETARPARVRLSFDSLENRLTPSTVTEVIVPPPLAVTPTEEVRLVDELPAVQSELPAVQSEAANVAPADRAGEPVDPSNPNLDGNIAIDVFSTPGPEDDGGSGDDDNPHPGQPDVDDPIPQPTDPDVAMPDSGSNEGQWPPFSPTPSEPPASPAIVHEGIVSAALGVAETLDLAADLETIDAAFSETDLSAAWLGDSKFAQPELLDPMHLSESLNDQGWLETNYKKELDELKQGVEKGVKQIEEGDTEGGAKTIVFAVLDFVWDIIFGNPPPLPLSEGAATSVSLDAAGQVTDVSLVGTGLLDP